MSIFTDRSGVQRWSCWATGTSGTAIDLVATALSVDVAAAIDWLDVRHGHGGAVAGPPGAATVTAGGAAGRTVGIAARLRGGLPAAAVDAATARDALRWLTGRRRLAAGVLEANQVGFDPGPARLRRPRGLPYRGRGVVLPAFDEAGDLVYAQVRYFGRRTGRAASTTTRPPPTAPSRPCRGRSRRPGRPRPGRSSSVRAPSTP